jgi:hypothetical protein
MPPFSHNKEAKMLYDAAKRLGYHPFPIPMLRNSVPCGDDLGPGTSVAICDFSHHNPGIMGGGDKLGERT